MQRGGSEQKSLIIIYIIDAINISNFTRNGQDSWTHLHWSLINCVGLYIN